MECLAQKPCAWSFTLLAVLSERLACVESCSFQMSWKDVSCQSPSRLRWSLCKSCISDVLYAKGSLALAPAQPLHSWVTSIKVGSPLRGGFSFFIHKMQRLSWWSAVEVSCTFIHSTRVCWTPTLCQAQLCHGQFSDKQNQTVVLAPWCLDLNRGKIVLKQIAAQVNVSSQPWWSTWGWGSS